MKWQQKNNKGKRDRNFDFDTKKKRNKNKDESVKRYSKKPSHQKQNPEVLSKQTTAFIQSNTGWRKKFQIIPESFKILSVGAQSYPCYDWYTDIIDILIVCIGSLALLNDCLYASLMWMELLKKNQMNVSQYLFQKCCNNNTKQSFCCW